jgi:predicted DNA-binding transcriptional regulator AlpA
MTISLEHTNAPSTGHRAQLTRKEAAAFLNLSTKTVERLGASGAFPTFDLGTGGDRPAIRYRLSDLERWIESRQIPTVQNGR